MPFVTQYGGLTTDFDVKHTKRDRDGMILEEGNGLKALRMAFGSTCDFNPRGPEFKETVWRGTPKMKERHWLDTPVFRIPFERFTEKDQERIVSFFLLNQKESTRVIHYEPSLDDIEVKKMGSKKNWALPLHVLKLLKKEGFFERAKNEAKVELPEEKKLNDEEYDMLMEALDTRIAEEKEAAKAKSSKSKDKDEKEEEEVANVS